MTKIGFPCSKRKYNAKAGQSQSSFHGCQWQISKGRSNMWRARMCISLRAWKTHLTGFVTPPPPQKVRYFPLRNKKWGRFKSSPSLGLMTILNVLDTITNSFTQPTTKRWAWTTKPEMGNFANNHESDTDEGETRVKTRRSMIEKKNVDCPPKNVLMI